MKNKNVKLLLTTIITLAILVPILASASTKINYQVPLSGAPETSSNDAIGNYVGTVYQIAMGVVGALAVVVMMFGGIMWMLAGGSPERIQSAKGWIFGAMSGLVLAFSSYTILNIINPRLVKFEALRGITTGGANVTGGTGANGACNNCVDAALDPGVRCKTGVDCTVNEALLTKLKVAYASRSNNWHITEAYTLSDLHKNICHGQGTCVDINLTSGSRDPGQVTALYNEMKNQGLKPKYELNYDLCSQGTSLSDCQTILCRPYIQNGIPANDCSVYDHIVGAGHFSIYMN